MSETTLAVVTPMDLIQRASEHGASIEQMQQLFELKLRVEADEAKKAFNEAFTAFKSEDIRIVRDKENTQYSKPDKKAMYTSLENMVSTVTPFLSKHGLSARWDISQTGVIVVACILTHILGHSNTVSISAAPDKSGAKNDLQQIKSTLTYLKVGTYEAVCGLASAFANCDDDGNSSGRISPKMPEQDVVGWLDSIEGAGNAEELKRIFSAAYMAAQQMGANAVLAEFIKAKDKRKKELA